jgi:hypothetical protein
VTQAPLDHRTNLLISFPYSYLIGEKKIPGTPTSRQLLGYFRRGIWREVLAPYIYQVLENRPLYSTLAYHEARLNFVIKSNVKKVDAAMIRKGI